jgi:hypothetical protein
MLGFLYRFISLVSIKKYQIKYMFTFCFDLHIIIRDNNKHIHNNIHIKIRESKYELKS